MNKLLVVFSLLAAVVCCGADLKVHPIFGSYMLMQRGVEIPVAGMAAPGAEVTVKFKGKTTVVKAGNDGKWQITLAPMEADAKGVSMVITSGKERKVFSNIIVGEVILLSGQSHIATSYNYKLSELKTTDPKRKLPPETCKALIDEINQTVSSAEVDDAMRSCTVWSNGTVSWWKCNPQQLGRFSVAGHNIAKVLRKELNVPVAVINMSRGSSSIESWIPAEYYDHPCLAGLKPNIPKFLAFNKARRENKLTPELTEAYMVDLYSQPRWKHQKNNYIKDGKFKTQTLTAALFHQGSVQPTACYENVVTTVMPFPVRALIWWQGETNYREPAGEYAEKMRILFSSFRKLWSTPDLPIAVILQGQRTIYAGLYSQGRLEQFNGVSGVANTYLVNNLMTPIAEVTMVHPYHEKIQSGKDAGALLLKHVYGKESMGSGPLFDSAKFKDGKAEVSFRFAKGLKTSDGKAPVGFEIAGSDKKYYPASAGIEGGKIIVSSDKVAEPVSVRFMWEDVKNVCNLVNAENLTAFPFDTQYEFFQKPNTINGK